MSATPVFGRDLGALGHLPVGRAFLAEKRRVDAALPYARGGSPATWETPPPPGRGPRGNLRRNQVLGRLHAYASMKSDGDLRVASYQGLRQEVEIAFTEMSRRTSYLRPEILALPTAPSKRT